MLPSHLMDATKKKNEPRSHTRLGSLPPPLPPSLCVTGALSQIGRWTVVNHRSTSDGDGDGSGSGSGTGSGSGDKDNDNNQQQQQVVLSYCIFRPRQLHDMRKPPLVVIHGGPSIPSNYLLPIVNGVTDRTVILYDQWGCGKSSRPSMTRMTKATTTTMATIVETESVSKNSESSSSSPPRRRQQQQQHHHNKQQSLPPFSIPTMVEHFRQLIEECWKLKSYHLLGHSWGGILAYEFLKMNEQQQQQQQQQTNVVENDFSNSIPRRCRSLVLASAPTSARLIQKECKILMSRLQNEETAGTTDNSTADDNDDDDDDETNDDDADSLQSEQIFSEEFHQTHECRLPAIPLALMDATAQAGPTPWRGIPAIRHYVATPPSVASASSDNNDIESELHQKQEKIQVPTMLIRGEYDFCTDKCMVGWMDLITVESNDSQSSSSSSSSSSDGHSNIKALLNCSHYAMLEDERQFGKVVSDFLQLRDQQLEDKK
mmetsp:Transcript_45155/g.109931  ORF Transcript_45155/g.109931 Transcript_45155/m.109931 type:complete len:487 (-) Transcript_45155:130-1590(-)